MNERKNFKSLDQLNERLDRNIAKGYFSLEQSRAMLREIVEKNGLDFVLNEIRRRN